MRHRRLARIALVLPVVLLGACGAVSPDSGVPTAGESPGSTTPASEASEATQSAEAGGLTVTVTWKGGPAALAIDVTLDTHSGDLDPVDLSTATLVNERGEMLRNPVWDAPAGGHHRGGLLRFVDDGTAFLRDVEWVELRIPDLGAVSERSFRWTIGA